MSQAPLNSHTDFWQDDWRVPAERLARVRATIAKLVQMQTYLLQFQNELTEVKKYREAFGMCSVSLPYLIHRANSLRAQAPDTEVLRIAKDASYLAFHYSSPHDSCDAEAFRKELFDSLKELEGAVQAKDDVWWRAQNDLASVVLKEIGLLEPLVCQIMKSKSSY